MPSSRLRFITSEGRDPDEFACAVSDGLSRPQKRLPCRFFYDEIGSRLFERICALPEYYLTRTERAILERYAEDIIRATEATTVIELGSGNAQKTRLLIQAILKGSPKAHFIPIDISSDFLRQSSRALLSEYEGLSVTAIAAEYFTGLALLEKIFRAERDKGKRLFVFLGSSIGNFDDEEAVSLLRSVRRVMGNEDTFLIGFDLVKDPSVLEAAYNDAEGITAAFNKNLLARINRELGGNFDLDAFAHHAPYLPERRRVEMRLVSLRDQEVFIAALNRPFSFRAGEYIHTENSHKYTPEGIESLASASGFAVKAMWRDDRHWFALVLLQKGDRRA